ncbi:MAG: carboxypeptidase-like regulatory domain-containing protein [Fuerstiella sp.]
MLLNSLVRVSPALLCLIISGCGGASVAPPVPVYPVSGTITFKGQPVVGADVTFMNAEKNRSAFGKTDAQGKYQLTTFTQNDGSVEGKSVVTIKKYQPVEPEAPVADIDSEDYVPPTVGVREAPPKKSKSDIPDKYGDPMLSGLIAPVAVDGANVFDFALE